MEARKWRVKAKLYCHAKVELRFSSLKRSLKHGPRGGGRCSSGGGDGASFEPARKLREAAEHQRAVAAAQLETFRAGSYIYTSTAGIRHATCRGGRASRLGCSKKNAPAAGSSARSGNIHFFIVLLFGLLRGFVFAERLHKLPCRFQITRGSIVSLLGAWQSSAYF